MGEYAVPEIRFGPVGEVEAEVSAHPDPNRLQRPRQHQNRHEGDQPLPVPGEDRVVHDASDHVRDGHDERHPEQRPDDREDRNPGIAAQGPDEQLQALPHLRAAQPSGRAHSARSGAGVR